MRILTNSQPETQTILDLTVVKVKKILIEWDGQYSDIEYFVDAHSGTVGIFDNEQEAVDCAFSYRKAA